MKPPSTFTALQEPAASAKPSGAWASSNEPFFLWMLSTILFRASSIVGTLISSPNVSFGVAYGLIEGLVYNHFKAHVVGTLTFYNDHHMLSIFRMRTAH